MKLEVNELKKLHGQNFGEKNLIRGLGGTKDQILGFLDIFSETAHQKFFNFLHDGRRQ